MQFTKDAWEGIADGSLTLTFRSWKTQRAHAGRQYHVPPGVIRVVDARRVQADSITEADAAAAGASLESLRDRLGADDGDQVWRIEFVFEGADPRTTLRTDVPRGPALEEAVDELLAIDRRSRSGPWAVRTLETIAASPGVRAPELAESFGQETKHFKQRVRRLKGMGLTESLRIGYRLSPRGEAVLATVRRRT